MVSESACAVIQLISTLNLAQSLRAPPYCHALVFSSHNSLSCIRSHPGCVREVEFLHKEVYHIF